VLAGGELCHGRGAQRGWRLDGVRRCGRRQRGNGV